MALAVPPPILLGIKVVEDYLLLSWRPISFIVSRVDWEWEGKKEANEPLVGESKECASGCVCVWYYCASLYFYRLHREWLNSDRLKLRYSYEGWKSKISDGYRWIGYWVFGYCAFSIEVSLIKCRISVWNSIEKPFYLWKSIPCLSSSKTHLFSYF